MECLKKNTSFEKILQIRYRNLSEDEKAKKKLYEKTK